MRLWGSRRRRAAVDNTLAAYRQWSHECAAVFLTYQAWRTANALDELRAFDAYSSALDREEAAANLYAGRVRDVQRLTETGLALQLAPSRTGFRA